jgi:quinol-cytochrome oxidoreductase complex cytochrome b subunit
MPTLTRWMVKTALGWLVAGLVLGVAMQLPLAARVPALAAVWPTYLHLLVVGWLTQLVFGVAFWLFPRYSAERPRGSERLGWAVYALVNAALLLRLGAEPFRAWAVVRPALALSALLHLAAVGLFIVNTWPRLKPRGQSG